VTNAVATCLQDRNLVPSPTDFDHLAQPNSAS
jgi:hypothetical protein